MIKYGNGKPYECPKKTLIEWEREWNIWVPELCVTDHFVVYDQFDAFDTMRPYNGVIKWEDNLEFNNESLYENFLKNKKDIENIKDAKFIEVSSAIMRDYIDNILFNEIIDNEELSLIQWEEIFHLWIPNKHEEYHYQILTKEAAIELISITHPSFVKSWNNESDKVYNSYMRKIRLSSANKLNGNSVLGLNSGDYSDYKERVIDSVPVKKFISGSVTNLENAVESIYIKEDVELDTYSDCENEYVDTVLEPVINDEPKKMYNFPYIAPQFDTQDQESSKDNNISNPIMEIDVESNKKNIFDIFNTKKPKNKGNIKKRIIKATLAIVASITTLVSVRATSNINYKNEDIVDNSYSYLQNSEASESSNSVSVQKDKDEKKEIDTKNEKINVGHRNNNDINDDKVKIEIGDIVTVEEDAPIYTSLDDAGKMQNGLNSSNDNEMLRKVEYIAVNYNDSIVYSNKQDEIDYYINNGGYEISVMTSINDYDNIGIEGSYNIKNIIKDSQKVKKLS